MAKLKLGPLADEKSVKVSVELPAALHRDLVAYGTPLGRESDQSPIDPIRLIVPMLERSIATDRGFAKSRRGSSDSDDGSGPYRKTVVAVRERSVAFFASNRAILRSRRKAGLSLRIGHTALNGNVSCWIGR